MKRNKKICVKKGFSVLEIILAVALFSVFSTAAFSFVLQSLQVQFQAGQMEAASAYAEQGLEIARAIRDDSFDNLANGTNWGLQFADNKWELNGDHDNFDIYERVVSVEQAMRDGDGNIVSESGTEDPDVKKITSNVSWPSPSGEILTTQLVTYLSRWK